METPQSELIQGRKQLVDVGVVLDVHASAVEFDDAVPLIIVRVANLPALPDPVEQDV